MRKFFHIAAMTAVAFLMLILSGCEKVITNCDYIIMPLCQDVTDGEIVMSEGLVAYAFFVNKQQWEVTSLENARRGIITDIDDNSTIIETADITVEQISGENIIFPQISGEKQMLLIVYDGTNEIYAWRYAKTVENLARIQVKLTFRPWQRSEIEGGFYTESGWNMVNQVKEPEEPEEPEAPETPEDAED